MKHSLKITVILLALFFVAQLIGLAVLYQYIDAEQTAAQGETVFKQLPIGERPPADEDISYLPVILAIIIGTLIVLLLLKYNLTWVWKIWFFLALFVALTVAFNSFAWKSLAVVAALALALWRIYRPNFWVQTFTELFVYAGLAAIFVPLFSLWSVSILLILIALYDAYAVWKSKHMITLAKSQAKAKIFAGLLIPYRLPKGKTKQDAKIRSTKTRETNKPKAAGHPSVRTAILGGGDIGFPLIFAGVVLKELGVWQSLIISFFAMLGLAYLFWLADEKKFYPAMPFIGAGCFLGLGVVWLISLL